MGAPNSKLRSREEDCFHDDSSSSEAAPAPILPRDVLWNIFWRIPPVYHLTLSLVCKSWKDTIDDPLFAKPQGQGMPKFVLLNSGGYYICSGNFCHGLICVQDYQRGDRILLLSDPINKQTIELPRPRRASLTHLGFDHVTCKFKVLGVFLDPSPPRSCVNHLFSKQVQTNNPPAHLLVQGSTTWRDIDSTFPLPQLPLISTLVRGVSCWLPYEIDYYDILTFNYVTERFGRIPYPEKLWRLDCTLINLRERLGFVHSEGRGFMDIWVWHYKKEIWAFRHRISIEPDIRLLYSIGFLDDQKMLFLYLFQTSWGVVLTKIKAFTYDQARVVLEKMEMNVLNPNPVRRSPSFFPSLLGLSCLVTENRIPLQSLWGKGKLVESWSSFRRSLNADLLRMIKKLYDSVKEVEVEGV